MPSPVGDAVRAVRDELLAMPVSPRVETPRDINLRYCRYVAEEAVDRLGPAAEIAVLEDGGRGFVHTWLFADGRHYDAECVEGVADHRDLPFFQRHPEAAVHVETGRPDLAVLRARDRGGLYPPMFAAPPAVENAARPGPGDRRLALVVVGIGLGLVGLGLLGEWALRRHWLGGAVVTPAAFVDLELLGVVVALVAPVLFLLVRPAHRASLRR